MSIKDNIKLGNQNATEQEVIDAAKKAEAHDFIMETEAGYETIVGERGTRLSGGQKQRIAIARMLLKNPKIILLDEATSALDNITERDIKQTLDEVSVGKTVIAVAHRLTTIMDYDCILVMNKGRIVEQGTYQELIDKKKYFYNLAMRGASNES
jgi:ATP-binding cassette subfamily B protein/subfamily B ATP-binding cassette protein MsbA